MLWVLVFVGIALLGLVGLVAYVVWLWHKVQDLLSEVDHLGRQAEEILSLLDEITPLPAGGPVGRPGEVPDPYGERVPSGQADLEFEPDFAGFSARHATHRY
ncbi:hypothetical protein [Raineyella fluvialis]|uniref:Uncharacterized protein n=1 Tax=Raineyella fluvialis TaxID=2662261 RepID=A0A5Q2FKH5_9ACTN|nr:hypothetical protein [Raineyella fluvialis]QGF24846.1 hypothetical protein Rai3103_15810 [Raineyella fluvialis]